jgi:two-component system NtrC family sensor kinase
MDTWVGRALVVGAAGTSQSIYRQVLDRLGFAVELYDRSVVIPELLARTAYDLVLIDLHLPGSMEALEQIQHHAPETVVLRIDDPAAHRPMEIPSAVPPRATESGVDGVLHGPFTADELEQAIGETLRARRHTALAQRIETARLRALLARTEARYRALLEHTRDAVFLVDAGSLTILEANPAAMRLSGYSPRELARSPLARVLDPPAGQSAPLAALLRDGRPAFEAQLRTRDGRAIPVAVELNEIAHDHPDCLLLIARDLSERQRQVAQVAQTEKLAGMGRLAASIAHEINNPLQAIHTSLHLLLTRSLAEEKRERYLRMAHEEVDRLIALVQRMLEFYRPTRDGMRPTALHAILESVLGMAAEQLQHAGIIVERNWAARLPWVLGNGSHLKQVFLSLILNAIEAMPGGGRLLIRTHVEAGYFGPMADAVVIEIADTGPGIPDDEVQAIFEPFYTTKNKGAGLGLAISHSIVERHGGVLSVSSDASGTTFRVALPALAS